VPDCADPPYPECTDCSQFCSQRLTTGRYNKRAASQRIRWKPLHFRAWKGQMGHESNLRPAGVEHTARCPDSSKDVQIALELPDFDDASPKGVQERPARM